MNQPRHPHHLATCFGCSEKGLRMVFEDDGRTTRSHTRIPREYGDHRGEAAAGIALAVMHEAMQYSTVARKLGADVVGDGTTALFAKGLQVDAPFIVEAWPGRRSGTGYFWYARIEQEGQERANCETWLRPREAADG